MQGGCDHLVVNGSSTAVGVDDLASGKSTRTHTANGLFIFSTYVFVVISLAIATLIHFVLNEKQQHREKITIF